MAIGAPSRQFSPTCGRLHLTSVLHGGDLAAGGTHPADRTTAPDGILFYNLSVPATTPARLASMLLLTTASLVAQTATPDTSRVTCGDKPPLTSRTVRSNVFVSPDSKHRAYVEVEALALSTGKAGAVGLSCVNNSRLFVAAEGRDFKLIFLAEPSDQETGNSLRLVDWSPDGRRLLIELAQWQYDSVGANRSILLYDSRYGTFQQPDLARALNKQFGTECSLDLHVAGFSAEGRIVLEAEPLSPEEEEVLAIPTCSHKKATYEMDRTTEALTALPQLPKLQHYAKTEPPPAK